MMKMRVCLVVAVAWLVGLSKAGENLSHYTSLPIGQKFTLPMDVVCREPFKMQKNGSFAIMETDTAEFAGWEFHLGAVTEDDVVIKMPLRSNVKGKQEYKAEYMFKAPTDFIMDSKAELYLRFFNVCEQGQTVRFGNIFQKHFDLTPSH